MKENTPTLPNEYFAAANGYAGFKSYFGEVFNSRDFSAIYVLKGGPGTGKSSFMKKLVRELCDSGHYTEAIYCSSDPNSLDGVISGEGKRKIAVIDGTAPHERDAVIPGAIDEIINLGDCWETEWLRSQRDAILDLNKEKSDAYKAAYSYMKLAGESERIITTEALENFDTKAAIKKAESIINAEGGKALFKTRLVSSFGRYGERRFDTIEKNSNKVFSVIGKREYAQIFMNMLREKFLSAEGEIILCPAALDAKNTDAIYSRDTKNGYIIGGNGEKIDADEFCRTSSLSAERVKRARESREIALAEAERWFSIASDLHFRLEEIYTRAMNFDQIDKIYNDRLQKIINILETDG